jgi:hypothetical protein
LFSVGLPPTPTSLKSQRVQDLLHGRLRGTVAVFEPNGTTFCCDTL